MFPLLLATVALTAQVLPQASISPQAVELAPLPTSTIQILIQVAAAQAGVEWEPIYATLRCESDFKDIQSRIPNAAGPNRRENSWGIAQINLPAHPDISLIDALDEHFAIAWTVDQFKKGNAHQWTCYRKLYG